MSRSIFTKKHSGYDAIKRLGIKYIGATKMPYTLDKYEGLNRQSIEYILNRKSQLAFA